MVETKPQKDIRQPVDSIKDTIKDKTVKLVSAVYLVTNFLNDSDEIKWKLRAKAMGLKVSGGVLPVEIILSDIAEILSLIDVAVLDTRASAMNFSILRQGYLDLQTEFQNYLAGDWYKNGLIPVQNYSPNPPKADQPKAGVSHKNDNTARRDKILNFIKQHNWSSIREIAKFIPEVSSKTIQRELAELVRAGALKKTGERRWSSYGIA